MEKGDNMDIAAERAYPSPFANSTLFPLLLMSLASQRHTPRTKTTFREEYDYIVVGAGSAGAVVASRLSEIPCVNVLLLEAGGPAPLVSEVPLNQPALLGSDIDWKYLTVPQKNTGQSLVNEQVAWPSGKTIGGSSVLNAMLNIRGNRQDYDDWAAMGAEGWSYEEVLPFFIKMEDVESSENVANGFHGVGGPITVEKAKYFPEIGEKIVEHAQQKGIRIGDVNGPSQFGYYDLEGSIRRGQRCSTAKGYLVPVENRTNVDIVSNAFVTKILIENGEATGVKFDFEGNTFQIAAKREVIMSAGAINTAQILMLSGIGPREELERFQIPVIADLPVGKNLQEHMGVPLAFTLSSDITPVAMKANDSSRILNYINNRTDVLTCPNGVETVRFLRSSCKNRRNSAPDIQLYFGEASIGVASNLNLKQEVIEKYYGSLRDKASFVCHSHSLRPKSRGTVSLNSSNPYDPPLIDPNYFDHPYDTKLAIKGMKECMRTAMSEPFQSIGSTPLPTPFPNCEKYVKDEDAYFLCMTRQFVWTYSHQVGTAKMGDPSDPTTVVDPNLRVKNVRNLRVVDASVMPTVPSGNTNVPTIMLAEKASDIIKSTITCSADGTAVSL
ncbi:LOW QUALITY PROTEIN: glucose dehydrogenase [FAD, quinone]-like [Uloborus diversus]|uniref:LOW QUALITY PROTEIN: glucose dehydrogenase [FAD, quinone]-like n=1 Tax=Uloborus diversus TaxID=327109 RepID=UPI00240A6045|nr:LOW QUALITY PROTEIN: glucose dehydrogenase [FAD, quinone]-like [Uloborus diversus]